MSLQMFLIPFSAIGRYASHSKLMTFFPFESIPVVPTIGILCHRAEKSPAARLHLLKVSQVWIVFYLQISQLHLYLFQVVSALPSTNGRDNRQFHLLDWSRRSWSPSSTYSWQTANISWFLTSANLDGVFLSHFTAAMLFISCGTEMVSEQIQCFLQNTTLPPGIRGPSCEVSWYPGLGSLYHLLTEI